MSNPWLRKEVIGDCTLYLGDCLQILPHLGKVSHIITDPPYSERTHAGHDAVSGKSRDTAIRENLGYQALSVQDVEQLSDLFSTACSGWVVWMTDHTLALSIEKALKFEGRYVFAPLPYFHAGRSVRITGDGPSSWTDWIIVSRTSEQKKWGTLRGGYIAGPGWDDKARMGGKPTRLMQMLVCDYSREGDVVCDPFMGAGTTGVACIKEGRKFVGVEVDEASFEICVDRMKSAHSQPSMFVEALKPPEQVGMEF